MERVKVLANEEIQTFFFFCGRSVGDTTPSLPTGLIPKLLASETLLVACSFSKISFKAAGPPEDGR